MHMCMILTETKLKNQEREIHTDLSSGTYNLDSDGCKWRGTAGDDSGFKETLHAV